ncbi:MAG: single-stranded DNA-binding protein [Hydrogenophaga sp.]|jgi:single-stranded DNA-binding protein|nr:single-stranded DNA-binding protein [Hydrogenophaga sp.]MDZ4290479.1 single-stranded DNA-binding protein [Hydrogenophaga sp.]
MIDALLSGRLRGDVALRPSKNGHTFAIWRMSASDKTGNSLLCSCITFSASAINAVQRLSDGDSIAVSGEAAIKTWNDSEGATQYGLDVTVHGVLTAYHLGRKRGGGDE